MAGHVRLRMWACRLVAADVLSPLDRKRTLNPSGTMSLTHPDTDRFILHRDAASMCDYDRPNTMREKHLNSPNDREALGHRYDHRGRVVLLREAVEQLAARLREEREGRGPWRIPNQKGWGRKGERPCPPQRRVCADR